MNDSVINELHLLTRALLGENIDTPGGALRRLAREALVAELLPGAGVSVTSCGGASEGDVSGGDGSGGDASTRLDDRLVQAAWGALRLKEFAEIAAAMAAAGIDVIPQKGMAYGLMLERGGPVRQMADIDILVRERDYGRTGTVLEKLGYREIFSKEIAHHPEHHERQFVRDGRLVEIHRAFLRGRRITVDYDALWARALPLAKDGVRCLRLDADDTFLYHCFHFAMHEFAIGGLRAVWEMRRLLLEDGPELAACLDRAATWNTRRATWCALRLLEICFPGPAPRTIDGSTGSGRERLSGESLDPAAWRREFGRLLPAPLRAALEHLVVRPSLELLLRPRLLPRALQLGRKALIVDGVGRALGYLAWYLRANMEKPGDGEIRG